MKLSIFKVNQLGDSIVFLPVLRMFSEVLGKDSFSLFTTPIASQIFGPYLPKSHLILKKEIYFNSWRSPGSLLNIAQFSFRNRSKVSWLDLDQGAWAHSLARVFGGCHRYGGPSLHLNACLRSVNRVVSYDSNTTIAQWSWEIAKMMMDEAFDIKISDHPPRLDLQHLILDDEKRFKSDILIHPGSSREYQRWSSQAYADLAEALSRDYSVTWVQSPEIPAVKLSSSIRVINQASVSELVSSIFYSKLFIGNNSGPLNIAYALGTPSVSLWGPTHDLWRPSWNPERHQILRKQGIACLPCDTEIRPKNICSNKDQPFVCLQSWSVDEVEKEVRDWISKTSK